MEANHLAELVIGAVLVLALLLVDAHTLGMIAEIIKGLFR